jgi:Flp pilus assembly protein TadG
VSRRSLLGRGAGERATATVEFALVLPLVLIMVLALLQVGLFVKDQLVVEECARAGARQAAVSSDDASVRSAATEAAVSLDTDELSVTVARAGGVGTAATVTVTYTDAIAVPLVTWLFPPTVALHASAVMRQEGG